MKIIIAGGNGFLGKSLTQYFESKGHVVFILCRNPQKGNEYYWNGKTLDTWVALLENADVLINLAGKSVDCRYNEKNKQAIYDSRIESTQILEQAIKNCQNPPKIWLNASSATIYIHAESILMTEENGIIGDDFSMNICKSWEKTFFEKEHENIRKVALRTSIVLGNEGGAFPKMKAITRLGFGGKQGRGNQKMSWIHIQDFCRAVEYIIQQPNINGAVNLTAPNPVSNDEFMNYLRKELKALFGFNMPTFLLEFASLLMQTETELLLKSRNVYPEKLLKNGFLFNFSKANLAIQDLLRHPAAT